MHPLGGQVHVVDGAQDVIDITRGQRGLAFGHPLADRRDFIRRQLMIAMWLDIAILDVDQSDFFQVDAALAVLGIDPEHGSAVVTDAEVELGQIG